MSQVRLGQVLSPLLLALMVGASTASCGSVDVDDMLTKAGEVAEDAGRIVKDAIGKTGEDSSGEQPRGGQAASRPPRPTGTISTGPALVVTSEIVGTAGGTVKVLKPGNPLDGLEIHVPAGAYPNDRQFNVSSAPVNGHDFGEYFTPATPLITIKNGGDYSDEFMTVRIPVDVPPDHFALAVYYDEEAGTLEGIPFNAVDDQSITIVTRHFSGLLVSIIKNSVLDELMKADIDSHFRPGIDDWQFTNYGSYIAKGGHCAGQCLTALWYFCEQPDGQDLTLHGRYDRNGTTPYTPDLWQDDSHGYRLASTVQKDINWSSFENKLMENLAGVNDDLTFKAFAYAIQLTGEPQEVGIFASAGGGHDMICYRVHKNSLYIADPNYAGDADRRIQYANGRFTPYESGANATEIAAGNSTTYETIQYCAKSATVDWTRIGQRWNEFRAGSIGNDRFPQYDIVVVHDDSSEESLADRYESESRKLRVQVKAAIPIGTQVYRNGTKIERDANGKYELEVGNNLIGIAVWGDVNNNPQDRDFEYIDFKYFNVQYGQVECHGWVLESITPTIEPYDPGDERFYRDYNFSATDGGYAASGERVIPTIETPNRAVSVSQSGSWTPLPGCVEPDKDIPVTVNLNTSLAFSNPAEWGTTYNVIWITESYSGGTILHVVQEADSAAPVLSQTETGHFVLATPPPGLEDLVYTVQVRVSTDSGTAQYDYKYVWRE